MRALTRRTPSPPRKIRAEQSMKGVPDLTERGQLTHYTARLRTWVSGNGGSSMTGLRAKNSQTGGLYGRVQAPHAFPIRTWFRPNFSDSPHEESIYSFLHLFTVYDRYFSLSIPSLSRNGAIKSLIINKVIASIIFFWKFFGVILVQWDKKMGLNRVTEDHMWMSMKK